jgi:hypothetical protein
MRRPSNMRRAGPCGLFMTVRVQRTGLPQDFLFDPLFFHVENCWTSPVPVEKKQQEQEFHFLFLLRRHTYVIN